jgi:hypothetical protein
MTVNTREPKTSKSLVFPCEGILERHNIDVKLCSDLNVYLLNVRRKVVVGWWVTKYLFDTDTCQNLKYSRAIIPSGHCRGVLVPPKHSYVRIT